jgi:Ca2+-binding RTX toxin-like protein
MAVFHHPTESPDFDPRYPNNWNGTTEDDTFHGLPTDDVFAGGRGADTYHGAEGADIIWYRNDPDPLRGITIDLAAGSAIDPYGNLETFTSIEEIAGTKHADTVYGNEADNYMRGFEGNDFYDGRGGHDTFSYALETGALGVSFNFATGTATDTYGNTDTFLNVESVLGSPNADVLLGSNADERFRGVAGSDTISGGGGIDQVTYHSDINYGGNRGVTVNLAEGWAIDGFGDTDALSGIEVVRGTNFADFLTGDKGANTLRGEAGADVLRGGAGDDLLRGDGGPDTFVFGKKDGRDTIVDFTLSDGDRLSFDGGLKLAHAFERDTTGDGVLDATELLLTGGGRVTLLGVTGVTDWGDLII